VVVNASREPRELACPASTTAAGQCSELWHLADHAPLTWPLRLPAGGSAIVFAQNLDLADDDLDGIANAGDECPATATGRAVNAAGCPLNLP
jgi:hypothetical protein